MPKYKVLKGYRDLKLERYVKADEVLTMTAKRAKEIETTLRSKGYQDKFIEPIAKPPKVKEEKK